MPLDPAQAERMRDALRRRKGLREQKMFGGICWMMSGNMLCGVGGLGFLFRVGKDLQAKALARPGASVMEMKGKQMHGFIRVDPEAAEGAALKAWIDLAASFVSTLPPK